MIFDEATLRKLRQLRLVAQRLRTGAIQGDRRSTRRGAGLEFADYRPYSAGDDLRRLDWNVYARLERPFIKLLEEDQDLLTYILIDNSKSMDWDEGPHHKLTYALRIAAALGVIGFASGDRVQCALLQNGKVLKLFGPARGAHQTLQLFLQLEHVQAKGQTDLYGALGQFSRQANRPGLVFLISDLFDSGEIEFGLNPVLGVGHELHILHVLSPQEIDPDLTGELALVDIEDGSLQEVTLTGAIRERYRHRLQSWQNHIRSSCHQRGAGYHPINTSDPWEKLIFSSLRNRGLLR